MLLVLELGPLKRPAKGSQSPSHHPITPAICRLRPGSVPRFRFSSAKPLESNKVPVANDSHSHRWCGTSSARMRHDKSYFQDVPSLEARSSVSVSVLFSCDDLVCWHKTRVRPYMSPRFAITFQSVPAQCCTLLSISRRLMLSAKCRRTALRAWNIEQRLLWLCFKLYVCITTVRGLGTPYPYCLLQF